MTVSRIRFLVGQYPLLVPLLAVLGILCSLLEGLAVSLMVPFLNTLSHGTVSGGRYLDWLNGWLTGYPPQQRIPLIGVAILVCVVLKNVVGYGTNRVGNWMSGQMSHRLRTRIHRQAVTLPLPTLDALESGFVVALMTRQVGRVTAALNGLTSLLQAGIYCLVFATVLALMSWRLTLLAVVLLMLVSRSLRWLHVWAREAGRRLSATQTGLGGLLHESLEGAREVRAFVQEQREAERFSVTSAQNARTQFEIDCMTGLVGPLSEVLTTCTVCLVLFVAAPLASANVGADMPGILAFALLLYRLQPQVKIFESARLQCSSNLSAVDEVVAFIDQADPTPVGTEPFEVLKTGIELESVTFTYPGADQPALRDVTLSFPAGRTTAVVGSSGAGKSTLVNLLTRFRSPLSGTIQVDGVPLEHVALSSWRARLGLVSQHVFLFNDTIARNIAYGQPLAPQEAIERAARLAHAHDFIDKLPDGYQTVVGDRGFRLSGGQRQRLALARALLTDPCIFVLDEATSVLDNLSEHLVQEALDTLSSTHTLIVIAHRLSTVEKADHIIVLEDGKVVEQGTPANLLSSGGPFSRLYRVQPEPVATSKA